jgi:exopolyphosphatase/guanosine-5'-triphosphate,3'-diphosphate pyrophosphatase
MALASVRRAMAAAAQQGRIGVIDVGSNSIRLVVYDRLTRAPAPIFNERVLCGLGRGLARTGRLNPEGRERALENIARFVVLARYMAVTRLDILATAAVRDASDGSKFVSELERRCRTTVRVLSGQDEARLAAFGVISGLPEADGIMGDLGGGSLELVELRSGAIGHNDTLPLGPLRLMEGSDGEAKKSRELVVNALEKLNWLSYCRNRSFFAVGGAWRAIARLHMEQTHYPLHVIHHYRVPREPMIEFCRLITGQSRKSLESMTTNVSRKRLETLPYAALVLHRVLRAANPNDVVFSALGIREGQIYNLLSEAARREDPLIAATVNIARADGRFGSVGDALFRWMAPLFGHESAANARLRRAACELGDIAWREHPDYRAEHACLRILRMPIGGIDHPSRAFLAVAAYVRYDGRMADSGSLFGARALLESSDIERAARVGHAIRVGIAVSGGVPALLRRTSLSLDSSRLTLILPGNASNLIGEQMERRFEALANAIGRRAVISVGGRVLKR